MPRALNADRGPQMTKFYLVNNVTGFLNVWNQFKQPQIQNFVFFWVRRMTHTEILGHGIFAAGGASVPTQEKKKKFPAKPVSLWSQFPCKTSVPAKPVSLRNQFPYKISFPSKPGETSFLTRPGFLRNHFPYETSFSSKLISLRNQFPCKTSFSSNTISLRN